MKEENSYLIIKWRYIIHLMFLLSGVFIISCGVCHPGISGADKLKLPYEDTVRTSQRAFTIINMGQGNGISGVTYGNNEAGINGRANISGDVENYGGYFYSRGLKGIGVYSVADNFDGQNYGGKFVSNGIKGIGVYGEASFRGREYNFGGFFSAKSEIGQGVHGESYGDQGRGMVGIAYSTAENINYGGHFSSYGKFGRGIYGETFGENGIGVVGLASGLEGKAIYGKASNNDDGINYGGYFLAFGKQGRGIYAQGGYNGYAAELNGTTKTTVLEITGGSDLSELFSIKKYKDILPVCGMIVSINPDAAGELIISNSPYDKKIAGIISGAGDITYGMVMGQNDSILKGKFPVALTGRVYCLAVNSNGSIHPGDLLTTSEIPGYAMKVTDYEKARGAILGKAMSSLEAKEGLILVLVTLQ
jgi:hypothetical protein